MQEAVEIKVARIEEKVDAIEKNLERLRNHLDTIGENYVRADDCDRTFSSITKELVKLSKQQTIFRAFTAGIGFAFSMLGAGATTMVRKFFEGN